MKHTKFYNVWENMKQRCLNPNHTRYSYYGGRGIKICDNWLKFDNFMNDMITTHKNGLTLDRIDVNGNYCKENCRWITRFEQQRNTRRSIKVLVNGEMITAIDLAKKYGIKPETFYRRYRKYGWSILKSATTLTQKRKTK